MEIKLNREEILCLIENIGDVAIMLGNDYINVRVENQKYSKFLTQLDIPDAKYVAEKCIRNLATTFDYKNDLEYTFKFDEITISSKILYENESWYGHQIGLNENEIDMFIDNRFEENDNEEYNEIDEEEERKRKEMEDLEQYEEQVRESDEINHKIQAEMEQYMFENGKDYEDYQEPQLYDTEDDYHCNDNYPYVDDDEEQAQCSSENTTEDNLVDSLNNDLDNCLSKE